MKPPSINPQHLHTSPQHLLIPLHSRTTTQDNPEDHRPKTSSSHARYVSFALHIPTVTPFHPFPAKHPLFVIHSALPPTSGCNNANHPLGRSSNLPRRPTNRQPSSPPPNQRSLLLRRPRLSPQPDLAGLETLVDAQLSPC